jgi:hypothetical protein
MSLTAIATGFLLLAALTTGSPFAYAQAPGDGSDPEFELPGYDTALTGGRDDLDLEDASFQGNPFTAIAEKWPEDLVIAPVPGYSPQLGWNLKLGAGYFLGTPKAEPNPTPSVLGGFLMASENGSSAIGGGASFHLYQDRLRVKAGAAYADLRYRFYGTGRVNNELGIGIDILQKGPLYFANASWRVWRNLYIGLGYLAGSVDSRVRTTLPDIGDFDPSLKLDIGAYSIPIEIDSRDHQQFPRNGWLIKATGNIYRKSAGSDFDTQTFKSSINRYLPMREQDVLALRAVASSASDNAPFFLLSTFGGGRDLRGYPSGRYRDRVMYAVQGEYRWRFRDRWVFTGFAGVGEVAASFGDLGKNYLPAGGVGARFVLSSKHQVSLSADLAAGKDGAEFYFGVGEAF